MFPLIVALLASLICLPLLQEGLRRRRLPGAGPATAALLLLIWPVSRRLQGAAPPLDRALLIAAALVYLGSLPQGRWRALAHATGWGLAAGALIWHGVGVDLELLRGTLFNGLLGLLFYLFAGAGLSAAGEPDPSRASAPLMLGSLMLLMLASLTGQRAVAAGAAPLVGIAIAVHLHLLPDPELDAGRQLIAVVGVLLAGLTLSANFSDQSRLGALASPLIWATPVIALLHRLLLREPPPHDPVRETLLSVVLCGCAMGMALAPVGGLAPLCALVGVTLAVGWLLRPWVSAGSWL